MLQRYLTKLLNRLAPREGLVLVVLAIIVGAGTGLAAVVFIRLISFIHRLSFGDLASLIPAAGRFWFIIIPVLGALLGGPIIAFFASEAKGHGVPEVMQALIQRGGRIRPRVAIAKICASALCIGTGGSAGREGPIVQVGSTLGSSMGQWLRLSDDRIKNLVACGAAAGIAATFNAPIAGVAFATEVLLSELQVKVFGNVVISAVAASIVSQVFLGSRPAFEVPTYVLHSSWEIILYVILGLFAAITGILFIRVLNLAEDTFDNWKFPTTLKPAVGALMLGCLAFAYPHLSSMVSIYASDTRLGLPLLDNIPHVYGSGFTFLDDVLQGNASFVLLIMLIFLKPIATSLTLGSGNSGGVFAPSLFTGAMLGGGLGHIFKAMFPMMNIEIGAYALVGMAAVFSAAARAPLTSMLIVFEMSNDYRLILPLMAAGMVASSIAQWLEPESIYTIKLAKKGIRFEEGRDLDVMQGVMVEEVMNRKPVTIHKDRSMAELFALFQETQLLGFPVVADNNVLYGMVTLQDMERTLQNVDRTLRRKDITLRDMKVWDVATPDPVTVFPDEPTWSAIRKMAPRDLARLPVVSRHNQLQLIGIISRSNIMKAYDIGFMRKQQAQYIKERMMLRKTDGVLFEEFIVEAQSKGAGRIIADLELPSKTNIVSIERQGKVLIPAGDTLLQVDDRLTVLCGADSIEEIRPLFVDPDKIRAHDTDKEMFPSYWNFE